MRGKLGDSQDGPWLGEGIRLHRVTLKFHNPSTELAFTDFYGQTLARRLLTCASCSFVFGCVLTLAQLAEQPGSLRSARVAIFGFTAVLSAVTVFITRSRTFTFRISGTSREAFAVSICLTLMLFSLLQDPHYLSRCIAVALDVSALDVRLQYNDPSGDSDSTFLLCLIGMICFAHVAVPIRWCYVAVVEAAAPLVYGLAVGMFGSPQQSSALWNMCVFGLIVHAHALGKRATELNERLVFMKMLREKQLRFQSEFELERLSAETIGNNTPSNREGDDRSEVPSEDIFDAFTSSEGQRGLEDRLARIMRIGQREHWLIAAEQLRLSPDKVLGAGGFGSVIAGSLHGTPVAVKVAHRSKGPKASRVRELVVLGNELRVLRYVRHPHIVLFHGACVDLLRGDFCLVLEMVEGVRLDALDTLVGAAARLSILVGVCRALQHLHALAPQIVHGDIKPSNIMVEGAVNLRAKLLDFGLSRVLTGDARPMGGTLIWMAPELIRNPLLNPGPRVDIFSFGRLMYFVTSGLIPLRNVPRSVILHQAKAKIDIMLSWPNDSAVLCIYRELVELCVAANPQDRPLMSRVAEALLALEPQMKLQDARVGEHDLHSTAAAPSGSASRSGGDALSSGEASRSLASPPDAPPPGSLGMNSSEMLASSGFSHFELGCVDQLGEAAKARELQEEQFTL